MNSEDFALKSGRIDRFIQDRTGLTSIQVKIKRHQFWWSAVRGEALSTLRVHKIKIRNISKCGYLPHLFLSHVSH